MSENLEEKYLGILLSRLEICRSYKPRFGLGAKAELSLQQFQQLYRSDPFSSGLAWITLWFIRRIKPPVA